MTWQTTSQSAEETAALAKKLAPLLRGNEVIELRSDVGGGKTTFTKGLVAALGSTNHVASPSFTVSKEYKTAHGRVVHFDFYRLQDPGTVADALAEESLDDTTLTIVEWADTVEHVLPANRIIITLDRTAEGEDARKISLTVPSDRSDIIRGMSGEA